MFQGDLKKYLFPLLVLLVLFLALRFALPIAVPFLLGWAVAAGAEPLVRFLSQKARLSRPLAAFFAVTLALVITALLVATLCALLLRVVSRLGALVPELEQPVRSALDVLACWLSRLTDHAPEGLRPFLSQSVDQLFSGSSTVLDRFAATALSFVSTIFKALPGSALNLGTWVLASYMISARLPRLHTFFRNRLPPVWYQKYLPGLRSLKKALFGWLVAQLKLSGITLVILAVGFLLLGISNPLIWALAVCLVDILPVLGTGTVLIPWAFLCLLQGRQMQAVGLLGVYCIVTLSRSVLEPRLVGKHLGLDPLVTLVALYAGFRFWGLPGMLLAPILAVTATQIAAAREE